jgi:alpha-methylacyl-CoA racemase
MSGPLTGLRVVELPALGPVPHAAMILADLGADIVRVVRPDPPSSAVPDDPTSPLFRGRGVLPLDLKSQLGVGDAWRLIERADVLLDGMRPGALERLGLEPDRMSEVNPRLVIARMTGWGQDGPLADRAGHDINYISLTGALHAIGPGDGKPVVPLNLVGDFGGGSMLLVIAVVSALFERATSGCGQVIDVAMVDGASLLMQMMWAYLGNGSWQDQRSSNRLDSGAPFYDTYTCRDGGAVAVGALEPQFFAQLIEGLEIDPASLRPQLDRAGWPDMRRRFAERFASRDRGEWADVFAGTDACVTPVLAMREVASHAHIRARGTMIVLDGREQAAPAPRFRRTPAAAVAASQCVVRSVEDIVREWSPAVDGRGCS